MSDGLIKLTKHYEELVTRGCPKTSDSSTHLLFECYGTFLRQLRLIGTEPAPHASPIAPAQEELDARCLLASATDLLNSWAREVGVQEAKDIRDIRGVADRLWSELSSRLAPAPVAPFNKNERDSDCLAAPVATGETAQGALTFEGWWQKFNEFSTDSDRLDFTIMVLSAPFEARKAAAYQAWQAVSAAPPPQPAGTPQGAKPFLYAIEDENGAWHDGESCVFGDLESAKDEVLNLNDGHDEPIYKVVPLYRLAPPPTGTPEPLREAAAECWQSSDPYAAFVALAEQWDWAVSALRKVNNEGCAQRAADFSARAVELRATIAQQRKGQP